MRWFMMECGRELLVPTKTKFSWKKCAMTLFKFTTADENGRLVRSSTFRLPLPQAC
jgi:hypothetical protein